jgi:hypothetical protein
MANGVAATEAITRDKMKFLTDGNFFGEIVDP